MADKIQFFPLDITYKVDDGIPVIYMFGRTTAGEQVCIVDKTFKPYFWVLLNKELELEKFQSKVTKLNVEGKTHNSTVLEAEIVDKKFLGDEVKAVKVKVNVPGSIPVIRELVKEWDMVKSVKEADISFTRRYLIDKNLTPLTLTQAEVNPIKLKSKVPIFECAKIESFNDDSLKEYRILAIDIETYNTAGENIISPEKNPIIMIAFHGKTFKKVITWKRFKTNHKYIEFVNSEAELIERFKAVIEEFKPDILTGYYSDGFDMPYIRTRADKYKIKLDLGLDYSNVKSGKGKNESVEITGIVHLDVFSFIRKVISRTLETDSLSLNSVAYEILGEKKKEVDINKLSGAWDGNLKELEKFCEYNLQDAYLTLKLCESILPNIEELVKIIGLPLFEISRMGLSQLVEWFMLKQTPNFNEIAPNKPNNDEIKERLNQTYKGGFVYEPIPGLYKDIVVFDFMSLYPTIISSHNVSPSTINCSCCRGKAPQVPIEGKHFWFCEKRRGFLPLLIEQLVTRRMRIKEIIKKEKKHKLLDARSEALKLLANSFYGYLGFYAARWYNIESARSVTAYGRHYIQNVIEEAKKKGFEVIYGDTDSIFIGIKGKSKKEVDKFKEEINEDLPGLMELGFEGLYPAGIFVSAKVSQYGAKKKYALLKEDGTLKIRGFETVRRNWSKIAKEVQEEVLNIILKENKKDKALEYVKSIIKQLREKKVPKEKVIISTQLQRGIKDYAAIGPHVAVAQRMEKKGYDVGQGSIIRFIVTEGTGIIRERARLPEEVKGNEYDADYYINNQVIPAVDRIFLVLGYKKEDLEESKGQEKLSKFFG